MVWREIDPLTTELPQPLGPPPTAGVARAPGPLLSDAPLPGCTEPPAAGIGPGTDVDVLTRPDPGGQAPAGQLPQPRAAFRALSSVNMGKHVENISTN